MSIFSQALQAFTILTSWYPHGFQESHASDRISKAFVDHFITQLPAEQQAGIGGSYYTFVQIWERLGFITSTNPERSSWVYTYTGMIVVRTVTELSDISQEEAIDLNIELPLDVHSARPSVLPMRVPQINLREICGPKVDTPAESPPAVDETASCSTSEEQDEGETIECTALPVPVSETPRPSVIAFPTQERERRVARR